MSRRVTILKVVLALIFVGTSSLASEALPPLDAQKRMALPAVGLIRAKGQETIAICTGTLVAPDLVVTSAHCTDKSAGLIQDVEFVAGLNGTRFIANSGAAEVRQHPGWSPARGPGKLRYDVAVIRLGRPIPEERVQPLRLIRSDATLPSQAALVGYRAAQVKLLHGRFDCALSPTVRPAVISSDCPVSQGNSGGAVLAQTDDGWRLAGVIVAASRRDTRSFVVAIDLWLRDQVDAALRRQARRSAKVE